MIQDKYWRNLLNATPTPTILLQAEHPNYPIVFANNAYLSFVNLRREDIVGNNLTDVLHTYQSNLGTDEVLQALHDVLLYKITQKQPLTRYEYGTPETGESTIKYVDIINTPFFGDDDKVEFIIRTLNDVTDIIEAQYKEKVLHEDLIKHEKFLIESQRIAKIGNWEVDMVNNTIIWSDVLKDIYEAPADYEPTFESSLAFYKDDKYREIIINAVYQAIEKHSVFDVELEIITAAGNSRWIRSTGKADLKDNACVRLYGVTQDITTSKIAEKELRESRNQYQALIESVEGVVWEADAATFKFTYISNKINDILGYTPQQWLSDPNFWANHIYEEDRDWAVKFCQTQTREVQNHVFDYRMVKADGGIVWIKDLVSVIEENDKPKLLRGVMIDVTESKLLADLDNLEKNILELVANKEEDLQYILFAYLKGIEHLLPHMKCSLMQVKHNSIYTLAAPSLPKEYTDSIDGLIIGERVGSCGAAAYYKKKVIVADISTSPLWGSYKDLALKYNLKACWSCPVINSDNEVTAVFGMYYDDVKAPNDTEQMVIDRAVAILKVILENRERARIIEETTMLITQGQELANFGNWQWDIKNNSVKWSDVLYNIYGVDKRHHIANYEKYMTMLHQDDRDYVQNVLMNALQSQKDVVFEERIIRPDGEIRYLKSWGRVICDSNGNPEKMIGSCLDVTAAKIAESQLSDIAWMQSHLVRAPLARLMGLIIVLKDEQALDDKIQLLDYIMETANELDRVISEVSNKAG
ncbi:PAS domain-containing protein [Mucilaginibacter ximonensis]|uniref:histidine kinase n=1 Tax=Mucilaginibacter ximonensis TaxID=538021 RepID=A0ABW5Y8R4_9SPHI